MFQRSSFSVKSFSSISWGAYLSGIISAHLISRQIARQWVVSPAIRPTVISAAPRFFCVAQPLRVWWLDATQKTWVINTPARQFASVSQTRNWAVQDALRLLVANPVKKMFITNQPPRQIAIHPTARPFQISQ